MDFDVLIIGGSIAGSSAALALKGSGLNVGIIDKAVFPRRKPCGEGLSGRGFEALRSLGISSNELLSLGQPFYGFIIERKGRVSHINSPDEFGLGISRLELDSFLLNRTREHTTFINDEVEDVSTSGEVFLRSSKLTAKVLIVGDGNGKITKSFNKFSKRGTRSGVSALFSGTSNKSIDNVFIKICDEFEIYVTPLSVSTLNVAVLGTINSKVNIRDVLISEELKEWLNISVGFDGKLFSRVYGKSGLCNTRRECSVGRILFAGDSVEQFDPLGGMGMTHAIITGILSGRAAQKILQTPSEEDKVKETYKTQQNSIAKPFRRHTRISQRFVQLARFLPSSINLANTAVGHHAVKFIQRVTI